MVKSLTIDIALRDKTADSASWLIIITLKSGHVIFTATESYFFNAVINLR